MTLDTLFTGMNLTSLNLYLARYSVQYRSLTWWNTKASSTFFFLKWVINGRIAWPDERDIKHLLNPFRVFIWVFFLKRHVHYLLHLMPPVLSACKSLCLWNQLACSQQMFLGESQQHFLSFTDTHGQNRKKLTYQGCVSLWLSCLWFGCFCSSTGAEEGVRGQPWEGRTGAGDWRQISKKFNHRALAPPRGCYAVTHHVKQKSLKGVTQHRHTVLPTWSITISPFVFFLISTWIRNPKTKRHTSWRSMLRGMFWPPTLMSWR